MHRKISAYMHTMIFHRDVMKNTINQNSMLYETSKVHFDLSLKQCYQLGLAEIGLLTSDPCWALLPIKTLWGSAGVDVVPILL